MQSRAPSPSPALAKELGPQIHINAICPGLIGTEVAKNDVINARGAQIAEHGIALKRSYEKRFGIRYVDFQTQKRTPKLSAHYYQQVIASNRVL